LGSDEFTERLIGYVKGHEDNKEIPSSQRYINIPALKEILQS